MQGLVASGIWLNVVHGSLAPASQLASSLAAHCGVAHPQEFLDPLPREHMVDVDVEQRGADDHLQGCRGRGRHASESMPGCCKEHAWARACACA